MKAGAAEAAEAAEAADIIAIIVTTDCLSDEESQGSSLTDIDVLVTLEAVLTPLALLPIPGAGFPKNTAWDCHRVAEPMVRASQHSAGNC